MQNIIELLPGEHLAGFIGRFHFLGVCSGYGASMQYLGVTTRNAVPQRFFHRDDLVLSQLFEGKGLSNVWFEHSFGYYVWPFLKSHEKEQVGTGELFETGFQSLMGQGAIKHRHWRWCLQCLEEDSDTYGVPYHHRDHQLPGVFHCYKHGMALSGRCQSCGFEVKHLHQSFMPPEKGLCPSCNNCISGYEGYFDEEMALIESASLLLAGSRTVLSYEDIAEIVRQHLGLKKEELNTLRGKMRLKEWHEAFRDFVRPKALNAYFSNCRENQGCLTSPLLRQPRLYDAKTAYGPLHPLAHLIALRFAGHNLNFSYQHAA